MEGLYDGVNPVDHLQAMKPYPLPEDLVNASLPEEIQREVDSLPEEFRAALILSDLKDMKYKEIAEALSIPVGTVMSRLHRARKLLRKALGQEAIALRIVSVDEALERGWNPDEEL